MQVQLPPGVSTVFRSHQNKLAGSLALTGDRSSGAAETAWYLAEPEKALVPEFLVDVAVGAAAHLLPPWAQAALAELPHDAQHICRPVAPYLALGYTPPAQADEPASPEQGDAGERNNSGAVQSGNSDTGKGRGGTAGVAQRMPPCPSQQRIEEACAMPPQVRRLVAGWRHACCVLQFLLAAVHVCVLVVSQALPAHCLTDGSRVAAAEPTLHDNNCLKTLR